MFRSIRRTLAGWISPESGALSRSLPPEVASSVIFHAQVGGSSGISGQAVNERSALTIPAVWSAVNCYVNTIGSLGLTVAERDSRGGRRPAPDHWAYDLLAVKPNRRSTSMRLRQAWVGHAATRGNGYLEIEWDDRGRKARALHLMDPRDVEPVEADGTIHYMSKSGRPTLPAENVLHLAMWGWDGVKGYSPIGFAEESLGVAAKQRRYQVGLFENSAQASGHLEVPGRMTSTQKSQLRDNWNETHQGVENSGNLGILDNGAKWVQTSFSPQDAELILGCRFSVEEVARIWGLPGWKLGLEDVSGKDGEQQNIEFYQGSILPWLTAIEQECDLKLLGRIERTKYFVFHDVKSLLRGNLAAETAQEQADLGSGVASVNEIRIRRGLDPIDDPYADKHWIPTNNLTALEDMGKATPPPTTQPAVSTPGPEAAARRALLGPLSRMIRREIRAEVGRSAAPGPPPEVPAEQPPAPRIDPIAEGLAGVMRSLAPLPGRPIDLKGRRFAPRDAEPPPLEVNDDPQHPHDPEPGDAG